jgi:hypothetical protein
LGRATEAMALLEPAIRDEVVFVALSVETDLDPAALRAYAEREGFPFVYAVMTPEFQRSLVETAGRETAVPPLMPHLLVGADGVPGPVTVGDKAPPELAAELTAAVATGSATGT